MVSFFWLFESNRSTSSPSSKFCKPGQLDPGFAIPGAWTPKQDEDDGQLWFVRKRDHMRILGQSYVKDTVHLLSQLWGETLNWHDGVVSSSAAYRVVNVSTSLGFLTALSACSQSSSSSDTARQLARQERAKPVTHNLIFFIYWTEMNFFVSVRMAQLTRQFSVLIHWPVNIIMTSLINFLSLFLLKAEKDDFLVCLSNNKYKRR